MESSFRRHSDKESEPEGSSFLGKVDMLVAESCSWSGFKIFFKFNCGFWTCKPKRCLNSPRFIFARMPAFSSVVFSYAFGQVWSQANIGFLWVIDAFKDVNEMLCHEIQIRILRRLSRMTFPSLTNYWLIIDYLLTARGNVPLRQGYGGHQLRSNIL